MNSTRAPGIRCFWTKIPYGTAKLIGNVLGRNFIRARFWKYRRSRCPLPVVDFDDILSFLSAVVEQWVCRDYLRCRIHTYLRVFVYVFWEEKLKKKHLKIARITVLFRNNAFERRGTVNLLVTQRSFLSNVQQHHFKPVRITHFSMHKLVLVSRVLTKTPRVQSK